MMLGKQFGCGVANLLAGRQKAPIGSDFLPQWRVAGPGQALQNFLMHLGEVSDKSARQAHFSTQHQPNHLSDHKKTSVKPKKDKAVTNC